jgi:Protein of unknown function (DUF1153)
MPYHWTPQRKAAIAKSILAGDTTIEAAAASIPYGSIEEVAQWVEAWQRDGVRGLSPENARAARKVPLVKPAGR